MQSPTLKGAFFFAQIVKAGDVVCAIGRYTASRGGHEVRRETGESERMMFKRIRAIGGSLMNAVVIIALVAAALTALYAFVPLNVARPWWMEIRREDLLEERVRRLNHFSFRAIFPFFRFPFMATSAVTAVVAVAMTMPATFSFS